MSEHDWTVNTRSCRSNDSARFLELVAAVDSLLQHHRLVDSTETTARLIVAQLAHKHGLVPSRGEIMSGQDWANWGCGRCLWEVPHSIRGEDECQAAIRAHIKSHNDDALRDAAPDLYAAMKALVEEAKCCDDFKDLGGREISPALAAARAAIFKAEGSR